MLSIQSFVFNSFSENTYVVSDETNEAVIIDPGCYSRAEQQALATYILDRHLTIKYIFNTHCHIDHVLGNDFAKEKYHAPLLLHAVEESVLKAVKNYAHLYGVNGYRETTADRFIDEKEVIAVGRCLWRVLFVPGHSVGHVAFYEEKEKIIFGGDVLFANSIGRTDLPGGNFETLIQSIHQKLFSLPDDVTVYPGHGPTTTLGKEKISNPYCAVGFIQ